ncbi:MAG: hypothetical protein IKR45_03875 [Treponema sp.]|nr:hypothetical protein [Treponema sp.]
MKKLVKILGLLLVAGALFVGCKQEANIDATEVKLSNGNWDMSFVMSATMSESDGYKMAMETKYSGAIKVEGETFTYLSYTATGSIIITCPSAEVAALAKDTMNAEFEEWFEGDDFTVKVDGSKIIASASETATAEQLANMNKGTNLVSKVFDYSDVEGAVIKTNKKKTEYKITYTDKADPDNEYDYDVNYTITIKKQK